MRGLFASGLVLALGWAVATASAQENVWRPVAQGATPPSASGGISLRGPVPLDQPAATAPGSAVTPVSFSPTPAEATASARAKMDQSSQPMPIGPALTGSNAPKGELIAPPASPPTAPGSSDSVVSRWIEDGTALHGGGVIIPGGDGSFVNGLGPAMGDGSCGDCGGCPIGGCPCDSGCCPCDGGCCPGGWGCCDGCCPDPGKFWASAEYLMWWVKNGQAPPLVTASPAGTPQSSAGVLGPNSLILYPATGNIDYHMFSGGRFTAGFAVPGVEGLGFEATYFFLGSNRTSYVAASNGAPEISRPIFNVVTGQQDAQLVAFPDKATGSVAVVSNSKLWGVEGNARYHLLCGCNYRLDLLAGFRFLSLDEDLNVTEDLSVSDATLRAPAGSRILVFDTFNTQNRFYGGQVGVDGEYRLRKFFVGGSFKLGMGVMNEVVNVNGATVFLVPGLMPITGQGGLLAQPTNSGHFTHNKFAVIPQVALKVGYQVTDHIRVWAGYDFLYASSVVRPGDQIDTTINRTQLPTIFGPGTLVGAARPMPMFVSRDYWAQGLNFGLEFRY